MLMISIMMILIMSNEQANAMNNYPLFDLLTGIWIGLVLDEKKGKNNGSINGVKYFECQDNYGMFVREALLAPEQVN